MLVPYLFFKFGHAYDTAIANCSSVNEVIVRVREKHSPNAASDAICTNNELTSPLLDCLALLVYYINTPPTFYRVLKSRNFAAEMYRNAVVHMIRQKTDKGSAVHVAQAGLVTGP